MVPRVRGGRPAQSMRCRVLPLLVVAALFMASGQCSRDTTKAPLQGDHHARTHEPPLPMTPPPPPPSFLRAMLAGAVARSAAQAVMYPADVMKTLAQVALPRPPYTAMPALGGRRQACNGFHAEQALTRVFRRGARSTAYRSGRSEWDGCCLAQSLHRSWRCPRVLCSSAFSLRPSVPAAL